jgi:hypothetical protein
MVLLSLTHALARPVRVSDRIPSVSCTCTSQSCSPYTFPIHLSSLNRAQSPKDLCAMSNYSRGRGPIDGSPERPEYRVSNLRF